MNKIYDKVVGHLRTQYTIAEKYKCENSLLRKGGAGKQIDILHVAIKFDCT